MAKDTIYTKRRETVLPFEFNETVASVFDDMLERSVPCYKEIIRRQAQLTANFYQPGSQIYDLGCSNGNLGMGLLDEMASKEFRMTAVDDSKAMLECYEKRLAGHPEHQHIHLVNKRIQDVTIENASVIIINFTLQFIPPSERDHLIRNIFNALLPQGILLLSEKVIHQDETFNALQQEFYYRFKKENGYSELEISQKRDALENILVPETIEHHIKRLTKAGFTRIDVWQKWFNFAALICQK